MKLRILHRDPEEYGGADGSFQIPGVPHKIVRNPDPQLHPFERAREVQRALVAAKLEKIFAKPLIGVLDGHRDAVNCLTRSKRRNADLYSGSCDGEIKCWNLAKRESLWGARAHDGFIRGLSTNQDDSALLSCGDDGSLKLWKIGKNQEIRNLDPLEAEDPGNNVKLTTDDTSNLHKNVSPVKAWNAKSAFTSCDHHYHDSIFLSTGDSIDIWDVNRTTPVQSFDYSRLGDLTCCGRFNPVEPNLLLASGMNNAIQLYDLRTSSLLRKVVLKGRSNALDWNPMNPVNFTAANEDSNLYTFDIRQFDQALTVHQDFTNAVLDVRYSPTGQEFVAASFDKTLRLFRANAGRSRDCYHGKRMQMVLSCCYSGDGRFVLSGSGDFCIRIWKGRASEALGIKSEREKRALAYREALKERHQHVPEVRRILRHHHVPKLIKKTTEQRSIMRDAAARKEMNRELHTKISNKDASTSFKKKFIVKEVE